MSKVKIALVYDRVNKWGGAERLLLALHRLFPDAPLYTSVYSRENASWAKVFNIVPSFLNSIGIFQTRHEFIPFLMPFAFESFDFSQFDLVISITSGEAKGIVTKPETVHVCYCLTPTRYLWLDNVDYFTGRLGTAIKFINRPIVSLLKIWDMVAKERPDYFFAISDLVKKRLKKYYHKDSIVIYPPLDPFFEKKVENKNGDYYLVVTRLVGYKRIDLAVLAANKLGFPLKIVGVGRELEGLKKIAGETVEFVGPQSESQLQALYSACKAVIIPGEEDFCLTSVEAQASGKPVIAYKHSGVKESVIDGTTGMLFDDQSEDSLVNCITKFSTIKISSENCHRNSAKFGIKIFEKKFKEEINKILKSHGKNTI